MATLFHKLYGPDSNDTVLQLRKRGIDCIFRLIPAADSGRSRPPIPIDSGHRFRSIIDYFA